MEEEVGQGSGRLACQGFHYLQWRQRWREILVDLQSPKGPMETKISKGASRE